MVLRVWCSFGTLCLIPSKISGQAISFFFDLVRLVHLPVLSIGDVKGIITYMLFFADAHSRIRRNNQCDTCGGRTALGTAVAHINLDCKANPRAVLASFFIERMEMRGLVSFCLSFWLRKWYVFLKFNVTMRVWLEGVGSEKHGVE